MADSGGDFEEISERTKVSAAPGDNCLRELIVYWLAESVFLQE